MPEQSSTYEEMLVAQRTIVPIVATFIFPDLEPIGTAFIIYTEGKRAIALTAAHNLSALARLDRPYDTFHPTTPQEFRPIVRNIDFRNVSPRVMYPDRHGNMCTPRIARGYVLEPSDIAVLILLIPDTLPDDLVFNEKLVIDSSPPRVGAPIKTLGYWGMFANMHQAERRTSLTGNLARREGEITEVFLISGPRNQPWPCFHCDIPFDSGMSGAPLLDTSGGHDVAVGIASSDSSHDSSFTASGADALASILWPAMTIRLEQENLGGINGPTLIDLIRQGLVADRGMAHEHIQISPGATSEEVFMRWM